MRNRGFAMHFRVWTLNLCVWTFSRDEGTIYWSGVVPKNSNFESPMTKKWLSFILLLGAFSGAEAQTVNAASCSQSDITTAISSASVGGTVVVPAGSCTWSSLTISKAITLQGAGSSGSGTNISITANYSVVISKQTMGVTYIKGFQITASNGISDEAITINDGTGTWLTNYPIVIQNNAFILNGSQLIHQVTPGGVIYSANTITGNAGSVNGDEFLHIYDVHDVAGSWSHTNTFGILDAATTISGAIPGTTGFLNTYVENNT